MTSKRFGRGFSTTNLKYFRLFYQAFFDRTPRIRHGSRDVSETLAAAADGRAVLDGFSSSLSWTHYRTLSKVSHETERCFYEIEAERYVRLFDDQSRGEGDNPTIGLIPCAEKNEAIARYSILDGHEQLFAAKCVTYLPTEQELARELTKEKRLLERSGMGKPPESRR